TCDCVIPTALPATWMTMPSSIGGDAGFGAGGLAEKAQSGMPSARPTPAIATAATNISDPSDPCTTPSPSGPTHALAQSWSFTAELGDCRSRVHRHISVHARNRSRDIDPLDEPAPYAGRVRLRLGACH